MISYFKNTLDPVLLWPSKACLGIWDFEFMYAVKTLFFQSFPVKQSLFQIHTAILLNLNLWQTKSQINMFQKKNKLYIIIFCQEKKDKRAQIFLWNVHFLNKVTFFARNWASIRNLVIIFQCCVKYLCRLIEKTL